MKYIIFLVCFFAKINVQAQNTEIAIGLIIDNQTKLSKSFAFVELIDKNAVQINGKKVSAKIVDYVYTSYFGIEGTIFENNVNLKLYKEGKKIKDIKCSNDWEIILKAIVVEIQKFGDYKLSEKFQNVSEGKQSDFYSRKIVENLPGKLTIQIPENKVVNLKSINANIVKFKSKNPSQEIRELIGKFTKSDLNDIMIFKAPQVPENFKLSIKPMLYPISKTITFSLKMLSYGGVFIERNENYSALNCLYTALNTTKETLSSTKEKAIVRSFAFKSISDIYNNIEKRKETSKLFSLASDMNTEFSNSDVAQKEFDEYYLSISKVASLCQDVENQTIMARNAIGLRALSSVSSSLSSSSSSFSKLGIDISSLTSSLSSVGSQSETMQQSSTAFFNELSKASNLIKTETFVVEGIDLTIENSYVSSEVLYYLISNPSVVKSSLLEYANDKPKLNKLLLSFYDSKASNKSKLIQDVYTHFNKIEIVVVGLESRNQVIPAKYLNSF